MPAQPRTAVSVVGEKSAHPLRFLRPLALLVALATAGCGGGGHGTTPGAQELSGSVGDGPVVGASIEVRDAAGAVLATASSDAAAHYRLQTRPGQYPLTITATGGTDLVTNRPLDFPLSAVTTEAGQSVANLNPFTTLIAQAAQRRGLTAKAVAELTSAVREELNFGLASDLNDPMNRSIERRHVANLVVSSEALAETLRRVAARLAARGISAADVLDAVAGDLSDGRLDGQGAGADPQVSAMLRVASAQVLLEAIGGNLQVDGRAAAPQLDSAIATTAGAGVSASALEWNPSLRAQLLNALAAAQSVAPSQSLTDLSASVAAAADSGPAPALGTAAADASALDQAMAVVVNGDGPVWTAAITAAPADATASAPVQDGTGSSAGNDTGTGGTTSGGTTSGGTTSGGTTSGGTTSGGTSSGGTSSGGTTSGDTTSGGTSSGGTSSGGTSSGGTSSGGTTSGGTTSGGTTTGGSTDPAPTVALAITNLSNAAYTLGRLDYNEAMFSDRDYTYTDIPSRYIGLDRIVTAKADRTSVGDAFLSFEVNTPVTVYLAHADSIANKPAWLADWAKTADTLVDRSIYAKTFPAGTVTLGGNTADGIDTGSMYFVMIEPDTLSGTACSNCASGSGLEVSWEPVGGDVTGYLVYAGTTSDTVSDLVFDLGPDDAGFDPNHPTVTLDPALDLGLSATDGAHTCFSIKAYNDSGESAGSTPVCTTL